MKGNPVSQLATSTHAHSADLFAAISAVCPIVATKIGDPSDRTTWQIAIDSSATPAQIAAAKAAIMAFKPATDPVVGPAPTVLIRLDGNAT